VRRLHAVSVSVQHAEVKIVLSYMNTMYISFMRVVTHNGRRIYNSYYSLKVMFKLQSNFNFFQNQNFKFQVTRLRCCFNACVAEVPRGICATLGIRYLSTKRNMWDSRYMLLKYQDEYVRHSV
jgi:hypothetical protein